MPDIVPPHRDERSGKRSGAFDRKDAGWRSNECGADGQYPKYYPFVSREEKMGVNIKYSAI